MVPDLWDNFLKGLANTETEKLFLRANAFGNTDVHDFELLQRLKLLDLTGSTSHITHIGLFILPQLLTLILEDCSVKDNELTATYFSRMKSLSNLNLASNGIIDINPAYSKFRWHNLDLQDVDLQYNELNTIHEWSFKGLTNLTSLYLRGNTALAYVNVSAFTDLIHLRFLDLSGCSVIKVISVYLPHLETFIFNNCTQPSWISIKTIFFQTLKSIKHVYMGNASMNSLWDGRNSGSQSSLFQGMRNLLTLDLKENPIVELRSGLFLDLILLEELNLCDCKLRWIESNTFEGLQSLKSLYLQNNELKKLPFEVLQSMGQLHSLNLDGNKLKYIDGDLFINSSKLNNLTLANNSLSVLNRSTFEPILNSLGLIDISDNILACTCNLKWLPVWLKGHIVVLNEARTNCSLASLEALKGKPLLTFDPAEYCGPNMTVLLMSSLLPLVIAVIAVVMIVAHRYRWFLRYKLFLLKLAVIGFREVEDARDFNDFEFHFNIMFAEEDERWVMERFRPVLEELLPEYDRNVYGDGDLPLGMYYCDAVHYVVERSFKTIVLVSRPAIQDNWFVIKFRTAADQVNDTQVENMVVIFLEDIPDDELPFLVRLYLSDRQPYLGWEEDERFHEYFWQILSKMLTINLRCNNVVPPE
ncbi:toll-like receptor 8 [Lytechinus pictus]|uniref:toll-like receptor 8 n=1 Tax=Lytechinus pictus TaxID=7653 RepID=UPI0030BA1EA0